MHGHSISIHITILPPCITCVEFCKIYFVAVLSVEQTLCVRSAAVVVVAGATVNIPVGMKYKVRICCFESDARAGARRCLGACLFVCSYMNKRIILGVDVIADTDVFVVTIS